jgi:hypothetical protein
MPQVYVSSSKNHYKKEGRLLLAVQAVKKKIMLICKAACCFDVPGSILYTQLYGTINCAESCINGYKLTDIEEEVLKQ